MNKSLFVCFKWNILLLLIIQCISCFGGGDPNQFHPVQSDLINIVITSPENGTCLTENTISISGTAVSSSSTIYYVELDIDGITGTATGTEDWTFPTTLTSGSHLLQATAYDNANRVNTSDTVVIFVDTVAPTIALTNPTTGTSKILATLSIEGTANDDVALERVEISVAGTTYTADGTNNWSLTPSLLPGGTTTITATVYDTCGNNAITSIDVYVNGIAQGWIGSGSNNWQQSGSSLPGDDYLSFNAPTNIFVDNTSGMIYVVDTGNHRVCRWNSDGVAQGWIGEENTGWQTSSVTGTFDRTDIRSFYWPADVWVESGLIYVVDCDNDRICKWDVDGNALGWIGIGLDGWQTIDSFNSTLWEYNYFKNPDCLFIDGTLIYVTDRYHHRICKWDTGGTAIGWIGGGSDGWKVSVGPTNSGTEYQAFSCPRDVIVDGTTIYIADAGNHRACKWTTDGVASGWIGGNSDGWQFGVASSNSSEPNGFNFPNSVELDSDGNLLVSDTFNHRVSKWDTDGTFIGWIGGGTDGWKYLEGTVLGDDCRSFNACTGLFVDSTGNIFVADAGNNRITKWSN